MDYITVDACPLCAGAVSQTFDRRIFKGFPVENRVCSSCGMVFQSPRMSDQALEAFYLAEYRQVYQNDEGPTVKDIFVQENRARALTGFFRSRAAGPVEPAVHLDIGCSTGFLLEQFGSEFGLRSVGVEPGAAYREYARRRGLEVYASLEELKTAPEARFGLVSMIHVLEHIGRPVAYLQEIRRKYLAAAGYLLVEVPNLYAHDCFEVAHLLSFSAHTLQQTLQKAGYRLLALRAHGEPRSKILPLYLTALAAPGPAAQEGYAVIPERNVKTRRQLGLLRRRILERLAARQAWLPLPAR